MLYTLVSAVVLGNMNINEVIKSQTPLVDCLKHIPGVGSAASTFINITAIIVILGALSASIMLQPRLEYSMAKDGYFFKPFAHVNQKYETPDYSILIQVGYAMLLVFLTNLQTLLGYFTLVYVIANTGISLTIIFCRKKPGYNPSFKCPAMPLMVAISLASGIYILYGTFISSPIQSLVAGAIVVATGLPVYHYWDKKNKAAMALKAQEVKEENKEVK